MSLLRVAAARSLGPQFAHNPHRMAGQDGAYSIPLPDGSALWYFGDTVIGARSDPAMRRIFAAVAAQGDPAGHGDFDALIPNTGLVCRDRTGREGLHAFSYVLDGDGTLKQLVPLIDGERPGWERPWCLHGLALGDRLYLSYLVIRIRADDGGPFTIGFDLLGSGLAVGDTQSWTFRRLEAHGSTYWWPAGQPHFATCFLPAADGWLYVYGVRPTHGAQHVCLARVRPDALEALDAYAYFDGSGWSRDVHAAAPVFDDVPNELSVSWNAHLGAYLAVHSRAGLPPVVGRTAPTPWGPWSSPVRLWDPVPPSYADTPPMAYAGKEHPELATDGGQTIYLTYVDADEYLPHLVEVRLA